MWCTIKLRVGMCPTWLDDITNCSACHVSSFFHNTILMVIKKNKIKLFNEFLSTCKTNYWKFYILGLVVSNRAFRLFSFLNKANWRHIRSTCSASARAHVLTHMHTTGCPLHLWTCCLIFYKIQYNEYSTRANPLHHSLPFSWNQQHGTHVNLWSVKEAS